MKLTGWTGVLGIGVLVAVAAVGLLGPHALVTSREPVGPRCPKNPGIALGCYEQHYRAIVARQGVPEAFADLKASYASDADLQRLCHAITHAIGQAAATKYSDVAEAFLHGDNFCGSGYYHGVLQGFAFTLGRARLVSDLNTVCAGLPGKERKSLDYFNCVHGLGHAIMAITGDDLFGALHDCDRLTGSMEQNACANGVFMENLIVDGAHGGHYSKYLKPSEPLYPCTAVDAKYKAACFEMQTSYALGVVRGDFAKVFALCAEVGVPFRTTCYQSLGRDAAAVSLNQVPGTVATCSLGIGHEQRSNCIMGAVLDFVYYYHSDVQAKALCAALDPGLQGVCRSTTAKSVGLF
jgi:hypothetical protein